MRMFIPSVMADNVDGERWFRAGIIAWHRCAALKWNSAAAPCLNRLRRGQPLEDRRVHLARIAMAEIVELAVRNVDARRRQRVCRLSRDVHREHPVEPAVRGINGKPVQSLRIGDLRHQWMERS